MRKKNYAIITLSLLSSFGGVRGGLFAQVRDVPEQIPSSSYILTGNKSATSLTFNADTDIATCPIPEEPIGWGMDTAWDSEDNVRRGTNYIRMDVMSTGRASFQPNDLVDENGNLSTRQKNALQSRLDHLAISGVHDIILNCDHEVLIKDNYYGKPQEWYRLIKASVKYAKSKGFRVTTVSPFNEPDYTAWGEGTKAHFKEIARLINEDPEMADIRVSAGNTLNCDQALSWYNYMKPYVQEGNTHQLAGSFDNYAGFWQTVRNNGHHATADELHNVGEAFIGAHYGMQTGVWWGWDGAARGEYCRASYYGKEIGYAENRAAWSAATVYKRQDGRIDAFLGTSERQANTSHYEFLSSGRPAYFNTCGPLYAYAVTMPGGTGYQQGQTNAELTFPIQVGEDAPLDQLKAGNYVIMNVNSGLCIGYYSNYSNDNTALAQRSYSTTAANHQQWTLEPVPTTGQGDLGYFFLRSVRNPLHLIDVRNWSTSPGGSLIGCPGGKGTNEQWFIEYAGNNNWYIRSRHSGLYIEVKGASKSANGNLQQAAFTGEANQQWRFMPADALPKLDRVAPAAPSALSASAHKAAILLQWTESADEDVFDYAVFRSKLSEPASPADWDMIGRGIKDHQFLDNDVVPGVTYTYKVKAIDKSRNASEPSNLVTASAEYAPMLLARYDFEHDTLDVSGNQFNPLIVGAARYNTSKAKEGTYGLYFNASDYMALPAALGRVPELTMAFWVYVNSSTAWQRIFDFGNNTDQYFFLTPNNGSEMRLVMKNGGNEQILKAPKLAIGWHYVAVTLSSDLVTLFVDGNTYTSTTMTIRPSDFAPVRNFFGRSQFAADPLFNGYLDDLRFYNYALPLSDLQLLMDGQEPTALVEQWASLKPVADRNAIFTIDGRRVAETNLQPGIYIRNGRKIRINY